MSYAQASIRAIEKPINKAQSRVATPIRNSHAETPPSDLNQEICGDDVSRGDTINLPPLQLLEEAAHDIGVPTFDHNFLPLVRQQIPVQSDVLLQ